MAMMYVNCLLYFCYQLSEVYDHIFVSKYNVSQYCKEGTRLPTAAEIVMLYERGSMVKYQKHVYLVRNVNGRLGILHTDDGDTNVSVYYFKERMKGTLEYLTHKVCIEEEAYNKVVATIAVVVVILSVLFAYFYIIIWNVCKYRRRRRETAVV